MARYRVASEGPNSSSFSIALPLGSFSPGVMTSLADPKSRSLMIGSHFIKGWSRTQNHVTMSSAEAELIAMVKCSAELLGVRSMLRDLGVETSGVVYADSSAALAIAKRKGAGKLRHINVSSLWVQERLDRSWSIERSLAQKARQI